MVLCVRDALQAFSPFFVRIVTLSLGSTSTRVVTRNPHESFHRAVSLLKRCVLLCKTEGNNCCPMDSHASTFQAHPLIYAALLLPTADPAAISTTPRVCVDFPLTLRTFQTTRQATPKRPKRGKGKDQQVHQQDSTAGPRVYLPSQLAFKTLILAALKDLHGEVGGLAYPVDVLSWDATKGEGRLRVPARCVRGSLLFTKRKKGAFNINLVLVRLLDIALLCGTQMCAVWDCAGDEAAESGQLGHCSTLSMPNSPCAFFVAVLMKERPLQPRLFLPPIVGTLFCWPFSSIVTRGSCIVTCT